MTREEQIAEAAMLEAYKKRTIQEAYNCELDFAAGAAWADENPQDRWISVDDELPPYGMQVLVYSGQNIEYEMWFSKRYTAEDAILLGVDGTKWCEVITDKNGFCTLRDKLNVTHWRNIEPPRKEDEL